MPKLFKNIEGQIFDNFETSVKITKDVIGEYGEEDYINMGGLVAFLQDFRYIPDTEDLTVPPVFGLKNKTDFTTIEISY